MVLAKEALESAHVAQSEWTGSDPCFSWFRLKRLTFYYSYVFGEGVSALGTVLVLHLLLCLLGLLPG